MTTTQRRTIVVDGVTVCGNVQGSVPGSFLSITNSVLGACEGPPPWTPPPGRMISGTVGYGYDPNGVNNVVRNVDLTKLINLIGRSNANETPLTDFPFKNGPHPTIYHVPANGYIAAGFIMKPGMSRTFSENFGHGGTLPGGPLDMCVSRNAGDFSNLVFPFGKSRILAEARGPQIKGFNGDPATVAQTLLDNVEYFLNIRFNQPIPPGTPGFNGTSCWLTLSTNHAN